MRDSVLFVQFKKSENTHGGVLLLVTLVYLISRQIYLMEIFCENCQLFHDGGPHHMETSPLVCSTNQQTGFSIIGAPIINELMG